LIVYLVIGRQFLGLHGFLFSRFNMFAKEFYTIIQNEESATNFLISKNLLVNVENILCDKCSSEMKYYIKKERGKERKLLRCKRKGCQTTRSIR